MDGDNPGLTYEADMVQLRVKGSNYDDVIVTAYSIPSICPPPLAKPVQIYRNEFSHLANNHLADEVMENTFRGDDIDMMNDLISIIALCVIKPYVGGLIQLRQSLRLVNCRSNLHFELE